MTHLFLGLNTKGYGETLLGLRLASELLQSGDSCVFLAPDSAAPLLSETPFEHVRTADHSTALLGFSILALVNQRQPDSVVLSDYYTSTVALQRAGLDAAWLAQFQIPVIAIDTWDIRRSGTSIDVFGDEEQTIEDWLHALAYHVIPVPIANPVGDAPYYCGLPEPITIARKVRRHVRRDFGLAEKDRAILFCTAAWQHANYPRDDGNRIARAVPELLARYVDSLGEDVRLIHVGPARLRIDLGDRYQWVPPLDPERFDLLLASCDLLVSANASATTISKALVSSIPAVALVNSYALSSHGTGDAAPASPVVADWIRANAPLYPFSMWPVGYHRFLKPLLDDNPYCEAVPMLELLDFDRVQTTLSELLFSAPARQALLDRQQAYVREVGRLPSGAALVRGSLRQERAS